MATDPLHPTRSEQRLRDVLRLSNVGIWDWDVLSGAVEHNEQWYDILGQASDRAGNTVEAFAALIHPDDRAAVFERIQDLLEGRASAYVSEHRMRTPRGDIWVRDTGGIAERDDQGRPLRVLGSITDISRLKAAEARARESEELLRSAIDTIDEALVIFDPQDRLVYCNQRYRDTYPLVADRMQVGVTFEEIVRTWKERGGGDPPAEGIDAWVRARVRAHREGSLFVQRVENNRYTRVLERVTSTGYIVGFRVDITELVQAQQAAEEANLAKSRFLATMSHELRTPMNGILGAAQLLMQDDLDAAARTEFTQTILRSGQGLLALLNDILDLSKVEADKVELEALPFQPARLLADTQHLFAGTAHDKGLTLSARWEGGAADTYLGDRTRLVQMLNNLVSNAVKFTAHGSVTITARPVPPTATNAAGLVFEVTDTGPGIAPERQHLLFQPFSQVDASTTREFGGTGLGLSIVRRLSTLMGGEAGLHSVPGQGATFWFRVALPPGRPEDVTVEARSLDGTAPNPPVDAMTFDGIEVLVVEDHPANRFIIDSMLQRSGVRARMVHDGQAAVDLIAQGATFDLILMDVEMPVLDGYGAAQAIRRLEAAGQVPRRHHIVALTANAFPSDREKALAAGMDDFIAKPIVLHQLKAALARWWQVAGRG